MDRAEVLARAAADFEFYAKHFLKISDKRGELAPLELNSAQRIVHERAEDMLRRKGYVRLMVVKGRQQGISTYAQARFRWKMKHRMGLKCYTIAHELKSTQNLFKIAKRYQENEPAWARPEVGASNANELWLSRLDSRLEVVTAGTGNVGRSGTAQLLHLSEAAYFPDPTATWAALGQVVPSGDLREGTEVLVETTGNGPNDFAERTRMALAGSSEYEVVFVPWFMQTEYRQDPPPDFQLSEDVDEASGISELSVAQTYGLRPDQMAWRRSKILTDFKGSVVAFMREYPANIEEAFITGGATSFFPAMLVSKCQKTPMPATGRILIGCDPAVSDDGDRCGVTVRQGRRTLLMRGYKGKTGPQIAAMLRSLVDKYRDKGVRVFLDVGGLGVVIYQILCDAGYEDWVQPVNFGATAENDEMFANCKAELYFRSREYLQMGASLPEEGIVLSEFVSTGSDEDPHGRIRIESKKSVKKRYGMSPDLLESFVLTFAFPTAAAPKRETPINDGSMTADRYWETS